MHWPSPQCHFCSFDGFASAWLANHQPLQNGTDRAEMAKSHPCLVAGCFHRRAISSPSPASAPGCWLAMERWPSNHHVTYPGPLALVPLRCSRVCSYNMQGGAVVWVAIDQSAAFAAIGMDWVVCIGRVHPSTHPSLCPVTPVLPRCPHPEKGSPSPPPLSRGVRCSGSLARRVFLPGWLTSLTPGGGGGDNHASAQKGCGAFLLLLRP